jgi:ABC-type antimicrobial peptide transport system permease subunit
MAEQLWPGQVPIGKRIHIVELNSKDPWQTVVGVVGRVKQDSLDSNPRIAFYLPHTQFPTRALTVAFRGNATPGAILSSVKNELRNLDPDLPMYRVRTMEQQVDESLAGRRFSTLLLGIFASVALALSTIGIYGVMAYLVNQGTRELGIRIALGASPGNILNLVVGQGMVLAFAGVAIGLAAAFPLTRLIRSLLFGVEAFDPITFAAISLLLVIIALLASYFPARRAARTDPLISLRCE